LLTKSIYAIEVIDEVYIVKKYPYCERSKKRVSEIVSEILSEFFSSLKQVSEVLETLKEFQIVTSEEPFLNFSKYRFFRV